VASKGCALAPPHLLVPDPLQEPYPFDVAPEPFRGSNSLNPQQHRQAPSLIMGNSIPIGPEEQ